MGRIRKFLKATECSRMHYKQEQPDFSDPSFDIDVAMCDVEK